jgi:predicted nucleic acid-binding Zn ribbon protein
MTNSDRQPGNEKRTRRRSQDPKNRPFPFVSLSAALQKVVNSAPMRRRLNAIPIASQWSAVVGDSVAQHAFPAALEKGVLMLEVDSSVWRQQLRLEKEELLNKIQTHFPAELIKEIQIK